MVDPIIVDLEPEVHPLYPPPPEFQDMWVSGALHDHQYRALVTSERAGRIHAPTGTGKSRAASFFAVSPYHRGTAERIQATFAYPTNLLTNHQFEEGLVDGLVQNLGYRRIKRDAWRPDARDGPQVPYQRLAIPGGGELRIAKLTGVDMAGLLRGWREHRGKADFLQDFLDWLNQGHNFLVASPDLLAYAANERYGSSSMKYHEGVKRRLHSLLRGRTLVLDEYHHYDAFTLINLERLVGDAVLGPARLLLLSATRRLDFFHTIPGDIPGADLPKPMGARTASRHIRVEFHFSPTPAPRDPGSGLALYIHNSVVENRRRCSRLRDCGVRLVQWDGTRKDEPKGRLGLDIHLVLGTSSIEVGLDLDADTLVTEWSPSWMAPEQITQRIGRVGRREFGSTATALIHVPGATQYLREKLGEYHGKSLSKDGLHGLLCEASPSPPLRRENYISEYYPPGGQDQLVAKGLLEPGEELRYTFRPPGMQALFLDRSEDPPFLFPYDKAPIINRYEVTPPTPDDLSLLDEGWGRLCEGLHINLEEGFLIIRGERLQRGWLPETTGQLEDLRKKSVKRFYLARREQPGGSSIFL